MLENLRSVPFLKYYNGGSVHWPLNAIVLSVGSGTVQEHLVDWHSLHEGVGDCDHEVVAPPSVYIK